MWHGGMCRRRSDVHQTLPRSRFALQRTTCRPFIQGTFILVSGTKVLWYYGSRSDKTVRGFVHEPRSWRRSCVDSRVRGDRRDLMTQLIDLGLDFETFYDGDYSLRKMENAQYVMDSRFEVIGFSLKLPSQPAQWYSGTMDYLSGVLRNIPWHKVRV